MKWHLSYFLLCPASVSRTPTMPETSHERNRTIFVFCVWLIPLGLRSSKSIHSGARVSRSSPLKAERHSTPGINSVLLIHLALSEFSGGPRRFTVLREIYSEKELLDRTAILQASEEPLCPQPLHHRTCRWRGTLPHGLANACCSPASRKQAP